VKRKGEEHWPAIPVQLFEGSYKPQSVRRVAVPNVGRNSALGILMPAHNEPQTFALGRTDEMSGVCQPFCDA
jgi:hypothetical protein